MGPRLRSTLGALLFAATALGSVGGARTDAMPVVEPGTGASAPPRRGRARLSSRSSRSERR
jgi:hypothetical protein